MYNWRVRIVLFSIIASLALWSCSSSDFDDELAPPSDGGGSGTSNPLEIDPLTRAKMVRETDLEDYALPYAGLPRLSIVTETFEDPIDVVTEIPAVAVFYQDENSISAPLDLTIRGRGNTSFSMPKQSYKIEFVDKVTPYGMPANRDWALLANHGDKTLLKNYIAFKLSEWLGASYTPRSEFIELYLNGRYRGIYQLCETIKVAKNRVNIPENQTSFLVEIDRKYRDDEIVVYNEDEQPFRIRSPKNPTEEAKELLRKHLDSLEGYLEYIHQDYTLALDSTPDHWFDIEDFVRHYWIQEFSKNTDAIPLTSVFFTWQAGGPIHMGPIWDFDAAFGAPKEHESPEGWYIRTYSWYRRMAKMPNIADSIKAFWIRNHDVFESLPDSIDTFAGKFIVAAWNNFFTWSDVLDAVDDFLYTKPFDTHGDAVEDLKSWIRARVQWIDENL